MHSRMHDGVSGPRGRLGAATVAERVAPPVNGPPVNGPLADDLPETPGAAPGTVTIRNAVVRSGGRPGRAAVDAARRRAA